MSANDSLGVPDLDQIDNEVKMLTFTPFPRLPLEVRNQIVSNYTSHCLEAFELSGHHLENYCKHNS